MAICIFIQYISGRHIGLPVRSIFFRGSVGAVPSRVSFTGFGFNKISCNCGPETLRDLGPTNPLPDFIPTNVGAPSNQTQNYHINVLYPFVNVYKRFIYG
jgi:hypothetical protein